MRLNQVGGATATVLKVSGKLALRFMRIGMTRTAIYTLMETEREQSRQVVQQLENGYKENIHPTVRNQVRKFNVYKGGKS